MPTRYMNFLAQRSGLLYWGLYFFLTIGFAFFYTMVIFEQQDLPGTLQRQGGFIPGIRPGPHTKAYLDGVIKRITWAGALFLAVVAIMPFIAQHISGVAGTRYSYPAWVCLSWSAWFWIP